VGSDAGSDIPDPDAGQTSAYLRGNGNPALAQDNRPRVRDENGNVVISKLESAVLQQLAAATGGSFFKLGSRPLTRGLVASLLATLDQQQASAREETKPIERFQWPLTLAIILLMIAWLIRPKRGGAPLAPAAAAALLVLATPVPGSAEILATSSTEGRASDAPRAYEQGLFEVARDIYARLKGEKSEPEKRHELAYGLGASSLKLKDYDRAVSAFSEALESENAEVQHRSHRGLGHALYDQGDKTLAKQPQFTLKAWTDAIRYFEAALKIEGEDKEVRENLDFVKSRIKELKAQIEQQQQKQQKQQGGKKGDKKEDGTSENGGKDGREPSDKGKQGKEGQEGQEGQQGQQGDQRGKQGRQGEEGQEGEEGKERDGGKGEGKDDEQEGKGARKDEVPEGRIQAGDEGGGGDPVQMMRDRENAERNTETGFSRNEARDYLRMFSDDQKQVQFRQSRREPARGKDW
jgi:Ca-activated chloride channel family protein